MAVLTVLFAMTRMSALNRKSAVRSGYAVQRPRAADGVGNALRRAFGAEADTLPADMRALLGALEGGKRPA